MAATAACECVHRAWPCATGDAPTLLSRGGMRRSTRGLRSPFRRVVVGGGGVAACVAVMMMIVLVLYDDSSYNPHRECVEENVRMNFIHSSRGGGRLEIQSLKPALALMRRKHHRVHCLKGGSPLLQRARQHLAQPLNDGLVLHDARLRRQHLHGRPTSQVGQSARRRHGGLRERRPRRGQSVHVGRRSGEGMDETAMQS